MIDNHSSNGKRFSVCYLSAAVMEPLASPAWRSMVATEEQITKLKEVLEEIPRICGKMEVARAYCFCPENSTSTCAFANEMQELLGALGVKVRTFTPPPRSSELLIQELRSVNSLADLAWMYASDMLLPQLTNQERPRACPERWTRLSVLSKVAENLQCLLQIPDEEPFPCAHAKDPPIWEIFAAGNLSNKQLCIATAYWTSLYSQSFYGHGYYSCAPDHYPLRERLSQKIRDTLGLFKAQHEQITQQGVSSELHKKIDAFAVGLGKWCRSMLQVIGIAHRGRSTEWYLPQKAREESQRLIDFLSPLLAQADEIAKLLSRDPAGVTSPRSWSVVSENPSQHSIGSERSCLSGHGGPHCFLPSHLFKLADGSATLVSAKDLTQGSQIIAADGARIEVAKVEVQKISRLLELEIDHAEPFITTPNHRILVPSMDADATMNAAQLRLGSWVICSDGLAKKIVGIKQKPVEEHDVFAITFNPDKAVECFLLPENPVVLSKGLTRKPSRRGGMNRRVRRRVGEDELASIPDTAPGEYED